MNTPWKYIKLSQLMASVESDLNMYDDAGMIDKDRVIKIVAECNEKLGQRIYKSRECKLIVENYKAQLPEDLYKIENIFATKVINTFNFSPMIQARQLEYTSTPPKDTSKIITYGKMGCVDSCNRCYWVSDISQPRTSSELQYETIIPLHLSSGLSNKCTEYAPCNSYKGEYKVDIDQESLTFSFESGEVYLCYLGNLVSDDGEIEIPFHPKLNSYYEYAVKEKILEDIFINSESDVLNKLKFFTEKKREAYAIAWDFANTKHVNEWNDLQKKMKREYYTKWYSMFN